MFGSIGEEGLRELGFEPRKTCLVAVARKVCES